MKNWKIWLVSGLWAVGGMGFLVKTLKQLIREEPLTTAPLVFALMFFTFALFFAVAGIRKSRDRSGQPSA